MPADFGAERGSVSWALPAAAVRRRRPDARRDRAPGVIHHGHETRWHHRRDSRFLFVVALLFLALTTTCAQACDTGYKDSYGRCVAAKPPPPKLLTFLKSYAQQVNKVGELADLFAPDVPVFDKPGHGSSIIYSWKRPNGDIESEATVEKILPDFYEVTVSVYEGPTSCGIDEYRLKGPKNKLRGYVPKTNPQGVASLWKFQHMSGLC